jgi:hypothetical protein
MIVSNELESLLKRRLCINALESLLKRRLCINLTYYPGVLLEGMKETTQNLSQKSRPAVS